MGAEMPVGGLWAELAFARELQSRRPQQAADVVGPEGREGSGMRPNFASSRERIYGTPYRPSPPARSVRSRGRGGRSVPHEWRSAAPSPYQLDYGQRQYAYPPEPRRAPPSSQRPSEASLNPAYRSDPGLARRFASLYGPVSGEAQIGRAHV